jgi:hypothetical protein
MHIKKEDHKVVSIVEFCEYIIGLDEDEIQSNIF